jgi:hypothetical protein
MNYVKIYNQLIERAKQDSRKKGCGIYYERHHIVPRCLGGNESKDNLVLLTAKEHYVAHKLLHRIYPSNKKLFHAYRMMAVMKNSKDSERYYVVSSREYEYLKNNMKNYYDHDSRIKAVETRTRNGKLWHSDETKEKIREKRKLQVIKHSDETRKKISESLKKVDYSSRVGRITSDATKKKMSETHKGKTFYKIECPHCKYIGGVNNMYKWHFDNCKKKNDSTK